MKDVKFMSSVEKELVLKQWTAFIKSGFTLEHLDRILLMVH